MVLDEFLDVLDVATERKPGFLEHLLQLRRRHILGRDVDVGGRANGSGRDDRLGTEDVPANAELLERGGNAEKVLSDGRRPHA